MKRVVLTSALLSLLALSACDRTTPAPPVVIQNTPGPTGATGATGASGMSGSDGSKGEPGRPGDGTTVIVTPPAEPASVPAR